MTPELPHDDLPIREQILVMVGELSGVCSGIADAQAQQEARVTKILEDHENRIKTNETFRARVKGACGAVVTLVGGSLAAIWKIHP